MNNNEVAFIKRLKLYGYTQKQICVIMNANKSTISRIYNEVTYKDVKLGDYTYDQDLENKRAVFDIIVECREIAGGGHLQTQDKAYIKLLKHCHVPYEKVRELYYDLGPKNLRPTWLYNLEVTYRDFDSTQIGIDIEDYKKVIK